MNIFHIRNFKYIYHSRIDFVDFWLCMYIVSTGLVCLFSKPLENIPVYTNLTNRGISSIHLGLFAVLVGSLNLLRLFLPFKMPIVITIFEKCLMLFFFILLLFAILGNNVLPLTTGYLSIAILLSLDNIKRT